MSDEEMTSLPYLLDFYPLQDEEQTRIAPFFENLRGGRLTTTRCADCGELLWQPRVVCPRCNGDEMDWVDLPSEGRLYAGTTIFAGLPLGMEDQAPMGIGVVELDTGDETLRILSRVDGGDDGLEIGDPVRLKTVDLPDGRVFYRFETVNE